VRREVEQELHRQNVAQNQQATHNAAVNSEGVGNSQPAGFHSGTGCIPHGPGNQNAIVVLSNTQQSRISSRKRNSTDDVSST
jgi:hypothetical protein